MIPLECIEQKYGGAKPNIASNFFPPDMSMTGKTLMTYDELKESHPDCVRYMAPWGQKLAEEEAQKA